MRVFTDSDIAATLREFGREALIWRQLWHPNLLPFFGIYYLDKRLCLVSPWMEAGNILAYLQTSQRPVIETERLSLMFDVAQGLRYLHGNNVVHGDLKAANILVTPSGRACIADFGLASIVDTITVRFKQSTTTVNGGTVRYQSPELIHGERRNFASDVYAYACTCYEILVEKVPFYEVINEAAVIFKVLSGIRPSCPPQCAQSLALRELWQIFKQCWEESTANRPLVGEIVQRLQGDPIFAQTTRVQMADWDETFTSKFRHHIQPKHASMTLEHFIPSSSDEPGIPNRLKPTEEISGIIVKRKYETEDRAQEKRIKVV
ncbi:Protein kinase domain-containing protein [Mycena indigotica]|uniref:Protein kinase domain-containing protein n=1 Tax=Mycena indigotica TaxID=2126181 RepID=A0A8H6SQ87_9AGAR|nr:Protein kinase domain-containing protein [Mycena indigotica]KAF7303823.1 Protein kinase domain-containing protein [Mycena indigotica]